MEPEVNPTTTNYQQVTVDVPEERIAEFHAFFGRFLARPAGLGRRGRDRRRHGSHGRGCSHDRDAAERSEAGGQAVQVTEA